VPHTLLLADDSVTIQRVIELTFADEDVIVVAVSDGDQAIEQLEASPPDIVLADVGMPGKSGYEVAQYMRRSPRLEHIPVVLLTGAFEPVDQARADDAGCDGVLAKPFEPQQVIGRVKELLARARRPAEVPVPAAESSSSPQPRSELTDYFDRLDTAFSALSSNAPAPPRIGRVLDSPATDIERDLDWFGSKGEETWGGEPWGLPAPPADLSPLDLPLSHGSPGTEAAATSPQDQEWLASLTEFDPVPQAVAVEPAVASASIEAPDERSAPSQAPPPAAVSEALIEAVTRRVLERLSDTVVRDAVADIASKTAERLVREEIERIKASIK
jgi:CheY-like chemotaxis protein